jgi:hypothetical protein
MKQSIQNKYQKIIKSTQNIEQINKNQINYITNKQSYINLIPDVILSFICTNLETTELLHIRCTNKYWNKISHLNSSWCIYHTITIPTDQFLTMNQLSILHCVRSLYIKLNKFSCINEMIDEQIKLVLSKIPLLNSIIIYNWNTLESAFVLFSCTNLHTIKMYELNLETEFIQIILTIPTLTSITLKYLSYSNDLSLEQCIELWKPLTLLSLNKLYINGTNNDDILITSLLQCGIFSTLQILELININYTISFDKDLNLSTTFPILHTLSIHMFTDDRHVCNESLIIPFATIVTVRTLSLINISNETFELFTCTSLHAHGWISELDNPNINEYTLHCSHKDNIKLSNIILPYTSLTIVMYMSCEHIYFTQFNCPVHFLSDSSVRCLSYYTLLTHLNVSTDYIETNYLKQLSSLIHLTHINFKLINEYRLGSDSDDEDIDSLCSISKLPCKLRIPLYTLPLHDICISRHIKFMENMSTFTVNIEYSESEIDN